MNPLHKTVLIINAIKQEQKNILNNKNKSLIELLLENNKQKFIKFLIKNYDNKILIKKLKKKYLNEYILN